MEVVGSFASYAESPVVVGDVVVGDGDVSLSSDADSFICVVGDVVVGDVDIFMNGI